VVWSRGAGSLRPECNTLAILGAGQVPLRVLALRYRHFVLINGGNVGNGFLTRFCEVLRFPALSRNPSVYSSGGQKYTFASKRFRPVGFTPSIQCAIGHIASMAHSKKCHVAFFCFLMFADVPVGSLYETVLHFVNIYMYARHGQTIIFKLFKKA
jgi:hypothetical protein